MKKYISPKLEVVEFETVNVIATSTVSELNIKGNWISQIDASENGLF